MLWSTLFPDGYPLIQRLFYSEPGIYPVVAPAGAKFVRASASPAGGFNDATTGFGGGGAFAFDSEACDEGDTFSVQVGAAAFSRPSANTVAGDSYVKRSDTTSLVYADRGRHAGTAGLAANSVGSITRDGSAGSASAGGASAGDDTDQFGLGFGGRGATIEVAAYAGGGGGRSSSTGRTYPAGDGMVCLEFYVEDPEYDA